MPESRVRGKAAGKRKENKRRELAEQRADRQRLGVTSGGSRAWVPWAFIGVGLLGVIWLVVYYVAGAQIPGMRALGNWNVLIGMGLMAASFVIATFWK